MSGNASHFIDSMAALREQTLFLTFQTFAGLLLAHFIKRGLRSSEERQKLDPRDTCNGRNTLERLIHLCLKSTCHVMVDHFSLEHSFYFSSCTTYEIIPYSPKHLSSSPTHCQLLTSELYFSTSFSVSFTVYFLFRVVILRNSCIIWPYYQIVKKFFSPIHIIKEPAHSKDDSIGGRKFLIKISYSQAERKQKSRSRRC